jgi:hypothetical protein
MQIAEIKFHKEIKLICAFILNATKIILKMYLKSFFLHSFIYVIHTSIYLNFRKTDFE